MRVPIWNEPMSSTKQNEHVLTAPARYTYTLFGEKH